jgi:DHA1 family multidrug resistance protein-like MFS transporter
MSTRRAASRLATQLRAVRDVPAPPSSRYLDALDRVGTCETRAQDDDRRASASGAGPLPRGFAASCATRSLGFSETRSRNAHAWTLPPHAGAARARASSSSAARGESAASAANASSSARRVDEPVGVAPETRVSERTKGVRLGHTGSDDDEGLPSSSSKRDGFGFRTFERLPPGASAVCVTSGVLMSCHACVAPALPAFATQFGASFSEVGACLSAFALARLVLNVPSGTFADKKGRRPLLIYGPLITAFGMFGSALASSLPELLAYRFVAGAGSAAYASGASATLADLSTSKNRGRVLGANQAAALAGAALGPALGGAIVSVTALAQKNAFFVAQLGDVATRAPFFAVGLGCLFAAFHAFRVAPETLVLQRATRTKASESERSSTRGVLSRETTADGGGGGGDAATGLKDSAKRRPTTKHSAFDSTRDEDSSAWEEKEKEKAERVRRARRDFFAASGVNAALFFSGSGGRATLVPLLAASVHGMDVAEIGALFSAMALTSLLGAAPAAALADAAPRRRVVFAAMGLSSVAVFATAAAPTKELFALSSVAWAASHALMGPAPAAYAADVAGPRATRGVALATYRTCGDVGMLVGPVALGAAADAFGAPSALGANGAALGAAAVAFRATASDRDHRGGEARRADERAASRR